jgi:hypothetical protein
MKRPLQPANNWVLQSSPSGQIDLRPLLFLRHWVRVNQKTKNTSFAKTKQPIRATTKKTTIKK